MSQPADITGERFGSLVAQKISKKKRRNLRLWLCICDCGGRKLTTVGELRSGSVKRCGPNCKATGIQPNQIFGALVTVRRCGKARSGHQRWLCKCVDCNQTVVVRNCNLTSKNTKSCGCRRRLRRKEHKNWRGHGDIPGKFMKELRRNVRRRNVKRRKAKIVLTVTIEQIWDLYLKQNRRCALTDAPIHFGYAENGQWAGRPNASLDRIDSDLGYTPDNVQWVFAPMQRMKMDLRMSKFVEYCKMVAAKHS